MFDLEKLNFNFKWSVFKERHTLSKPDLFFRILQIFLAEFLGTLMLIFWGCSVLGHLNSGAVEYWLHGIIVYICFQIFEPMTNSHINPTVTITFFVFGYVSLVLSIFYIIAQILGAAVGYFLFMAFSTEELISYRYEIAENVCIPNVDDFHPIGAMIVEAIATGITCMIISRICNPNNRKDIKSKAPEMCIAVFAISYTISDFIGAAFNPARSLGPAIITGHFKDIWVYCAGPMFVSLLASILYHIFFLPKVYYIDEDKEEGEN